jgi:GntR family transcriptional regulator
MPPETPRHQRIAEEIYRWIADGTYPPGSRLPSETDLVARFAVARGTIRSALASLRDDGVIESRRGARWTVLGGRITQNFGALTSFSEWALSLGEIPGGRIVELRWRAAGALDVERLGVPVDTPVLQLVRVRLLSGQPMMIERTSFPAHVGEVVERADLVKGSIFAALQQAGLHPVRGTHRIDAVAAGSEDARLLEIPRRAPLLRELRRSTGSVGTTLEWSDDRYRGDAIAFVIENAAQIRGLGRHLDAGALGAR